MSATVRSALRHSFLASLLAAAFVVTFAGGEAPLRAQEKSATASGQSSAASADPILKAMREELDRSKSQLKMENVAAPYYIEYRVSDVDQYDAEAAFGALRQEQRVHARSLRVVVRVGDYKQDSYYGPGTGVVSFAPIDDDPIALRRELWIATDRAYKSASEALASKKALLSQYTADQPFDDFARAPALQMFGPLVRLDFRAEPWKEAIEKATDLYRSDAKIESLDALLRFRAVNQYFVNYRRDRTRQGYAVYSLNLSAETQADDGMELGRSPYYVATTADELPSQEKLLADTAKMLQTAEDAARGPDGGRGLPRPRTFFERRGERHSGFHDRRKCAGHSSEAGCFGAHGG